MIDEGTIKFVSHWRKAAPRDCRELDELIRWRCPLHRAGLIGHFVDHDIGYGNLSARLRDGSGFVISGTQTGHIEQASAAHFAFVTGYDIEANSVTSSGPVEASSESLTHAAIYELDEAIGAVVHVHSDRLWDVSKGDLPSTRASVAYGTPQMAREFRRLFGETTFGNTGIARMAGHAGGLISFGQDVREAAGRMLDLAGADY